MELKKPRILIVGDFMIDQYFFGNANRISPEAPTPIVDVDKVEQRLGGAANVSNNIAKMGAVAIVCGVIGDDEYGKYMIKEFKKIKANAVTIVKEVKRPTTVKNRVIVGHHNLLRYDIEDSSQIKSETTKTLIGKIKKIIDKVDGIIISDYDKGVVSTTLIKFLREISIKKEIPLMVDPKKQNHKENFGEHAIIKTNLKNAMISVQKQDESKITKEEVIKRLCKINGTKKIILTLGSKGMICYIDGKFTKMENKEKSVFDVTGAGDVVLSTFAISYL